MEQIHYTKVILNKDPLRLPKNDDQYFVCRHGFKSVMDFKKGKSEIAWLKEIRWYLNPD